MIQITVHKCAKVGEENTKLNMQKIVIYNFTLAVLYN